MKAGINHGATNNYGYEAVQDKVHMHDWHATILHLLGLDHERLTYRYTGRNMRLTDVKEKSSRKLWPELVPGKQVLDQEIRDNKNGRYWT